MEVRRSPELERLAEEARLAAERHDDQWLADRTAEGEVIAWGTDPGEIWRGRDAVLGMTTTEIQQLNEDAGVSYERSTVEAYEAGDTGFVVSHGHFVTGDGTMFPARGISVYARDDDGWRWVGGGMSLLVKNEVMVSGSPIGQVGTAA